MLVQGPRNQLLAGAGLAGDQDGDMALAQAADGAENVLHGRSLAHHLGRIGTCGVGDFLAQTFFQRAANQLHRFGQIKGLGQVFECAALEGAHGAVQVRKRSHDDHGQTGVPRFDLVQQFEAGLAGHADVADQDLRTRFIGGGQRAQHLGGTGKTACRQLLAQQRLFENEANRLVVIDYPNGLHGGCVSEECLRAKESKS